jgi:hypothetical protein
MRTLPVTLSGRFIAYNAVTIGDEALTRFLTLRGRSMRFIRKMPLSSELLNSAQAVTIGETDVPLPTRNR